MYNKKHYIEAVQLMKTIIKKLFKVVFYILGGLVAFLVLYAFMTWILIVIPVNKNAPKEGPDEISIYILSNGVHTDIVVPVRNEMMDWTRITKFEGTESKDTTFKYVAFGWGDKGFYLQTPEWSDLKFSVAFEAIFHLGSTAIHADFCRSMQPGENCKEIKLSKDQYLKLIDYLKGSFSYNDSGQPIQIYVRKGKKGYGADDAFYEAKGAYDIFNTCNTWANSALKSCDQKACLWTPIMQGIFYQYK
jgi:uncharacterized protein (TIGR02117 family)